MAGISIKPATPVSAIEHLLHKLDLVLIMTVEPGFGGQKFMDDQVEKIKELKGKISKNSLKTVIEVDGGVNGENAKILRAAGADILVAGSYVFGAVDRKTAIKSLK
jgi:ribulose-phosphate 3-epimerase